MSLSQVSECLSGQQGIGWEVLLPHLAGVVVEAAAVTGGLVCLRARARADHGVCPRCGQVSGRVHSRYGRQLADAAIGGRRVRIQLAARRFFCASPGCPKKTFAEQVAGLTSRRARRTPPLARSLTGIGLALAGRAGERLAGLLDLDAGRSGLLRLVMALPDPAPGTVLALGVDDFAFRRGRSYGTVLVNADTGRPVDLLPDREAGTFASWLREHPGTEVICRDRAGAYADGARQGAPGATQIADRWHLLHNLAGHVRNEVTRHRGCLAGPGPEPEPPAGEPAPDLQQAAAAAADARAAGSVLGRRTRQRYDQVQALRARGETISEITRQTGLTRPTVHRYCHAAGLDDLLATAPGRRPSLLDDHKPYLNQRWSQGQASARKLYTEIRDRGYRGGYGLVRAYLQPFRAQTTAPPATPAPPRARDVTSWLLRRPDSLTEQETLTLQQITARCPEIAALAGHITAFARMLTSRRGCQLDDWIAAASASGLPSLQSFTTGIRQDYDAVLHGLTLPWSSGVVEGNVNRIKMLKRQMYGRASFPLLRKRVLLAH